MIQALQFGNRGRDFPRGFVVGEIEYHEAAEVADLGGDLAGVAVADEIQDAEVRERRDAVGDLAREALPVNDDERGELIELADGGEMVMVM
ncbi:unnamed protein product [Linum trigynum]|uniref:Uncharacterized protein n=1 Tax=Linum trigynum TaxID=586398 RepID=A0AAV2CQX8_9ROSI